MRRIRRLMWCMTGFFAEKSACRKAGFRDAFSLRLGKYGFSDHKIGGTIIMQNRYKRRNIRKYNL